jgi:hypothetical protein
MNKVVKLSTHVKYLKRRKKKDVYSWNNRARREELTELEQALQKRIAID